MNDVLTIIKRGEAETILEKLNRAHRNIDFTTEIQKEGEIPFLDLKIIKERWDFEFDIYRMVATPLNEERRNKEINYILETAKKNGYNRNLIEIRIKKKVRQALRHQPSTLFREVNTEPEEWIILGCCK